MYAAAAQTTTQHTTCRLAALARKLQAEDDAMGRSGAGTWHESSLELMQGLAVEDLDVDAIDLAIFSSACAH